VLDTNVVLDWLVFREPGTAALAHAIVAGELRWLASSGMRSELDHVLSRGIGERWLPDFSLIDDMWRRWAIMIEPQAMPPDTRLQCTDPLDQVFIDLALSSGARWLVSRDRALLKLARRAAPRGLGVLTPEGWAAVRQKEREAASALAVLQRSW
jgi:putative PIN family toxin of toxin-antitoxin system